MLLYRGMEGNDCVLAVVLAAGEADIAHNANQPATRYEGIKAALPDTVEFYQELLIVRDIAHLIRMLAVVLQRPVRRGRHDQMHGVGCEKVDVAGIVAVEVVPGWNLRQPILDGGDRLRILRNPRQVGLVVGDFPDFRGKPIGGVKYLGRGGLGNGLLCVGAGTHMRILRCLVPLRHRKSPATGREKL